MIIMYWPILACSVFLLNALLAAGETGCPEPEDIAPCTCSRLPTVRLTCSGLQSTDELSRVFANSERYTFHQVYLKNAVISAIPSEIFQKVTVKEIYVQNSALFTLFSDIEVENYDIHKVQIEYTNIFRTIAAKNLTRLVNLKELNVYNSEISTLSKSFGDIMPKNIKKITLSETETKKISQGALNHVPNLDKFAVEYGNLKTLSRDSFPRPFYVRILRFKANQITSIPEDLFTDMPNLQFLNMMVNAISVIPETAFAGRTLNVPYLKFEGNPLQCDCQLLWLIKDKPEVLGGTCSDPEKFAGRELQDLKPAEISCSN